MNKESPFIPKNAGPLVDELLKRMDRVLKHGLFTVKGSTPIQKGDVSQLCDDLWHLRSYCYAFRYRWCRVDALVHYISIGLDDSDPDTMRVHSGTSDFDPVIKEIPVPSSIIRVLRKCIADNEEPDHEGLLSVRGSLLMLERDLLIRAEIEVADDIPMAAESGAPSKACTSTTENIIDNGSTDGPDESRGDCRLTDSGQTIQCPKGRFSFTPAQAQIIRVFWENFLNGNAYLDAGDAMEQANRKSINIHDAFKKRKTEFQSVFEQHPKEKNLWRLKLD